MNSESEGIKNQINIMDNTLREIAGRKRKFF